MVGADASGISVLTPLADAAQIIRFDQRGHGRSDPGLPEQWNVPTWADDLAGLVAELGAERPVLFGVSSARTSRWPVPPAIRSVSPG